MRVSITSYLTIALLGLSCYGLTETEKTSEVERIGRVLELKAGDIVADVGAGDGDWTVRLARVVGPGGRVFANEVEKSKVKKIEKAVRAAELSNVETFLGDDDGTGLPEACCDVLLLRVVYHHFSNPEKMRLDLWRILKPGARILIVEFPPRSSGNRHGIKREELAEAMTSSGFVLDRTIDTWGSGGRRYALLFRKPTN